MIAADKRANILKPKRNSSDKSQTNQVIRSKFSQGLFVVLPNSSFLNRATEVRATHIFS